MHLCVVSFKECWRTEDGWHSYGGFPVQMDAISQLFDTMTLVVVEGSPRSGGSPLPRHARVVPLPSPVGEDWARKLSVVGRLPNYLRLILAEIRRADVVHSPLPGDIAFLGFLAGLACKKRMVARYGGSWSDTPETTFMNRVTRACMRAVAGGRNVVLATGLGTQPPAPHMHWLFATAVSCDELKLISPNLSRPRRRPLRLIYAGRLSREKGVEYLLHGMASAYDQGFVQLGTLELYLAGDGSDRARLEAMVRRHPLRHNIAFLGQLDRSRLLQELASSDVCVLPSLTESFCKARLDAMLCGVPVLTTWVGFGREIVGRDGERGWVVAPETPMRSQTRSHASSLTPRIGPS